eukprot:COSAG01_NODE_3433_length_6100_cov_47.049492_2_plen_245_part_00
MLNTYVDPSGESEKLFYDVHFWIGAESSQDEYGVAAYKTVELDDLLGGDPIQHRQCMGHESELFLSYFPAGLSIMSGGIESGFRKVETAEYTPRLLQVQRTGGQTRHFEIDLSAASLNSGDSFILDTGAKIYVYHGEDSDGFEKLNATSTAEKMESDRGDGSERVDVDEGFWEVLGGTETDVGSDSTATQAAEFSGPTLYSLDDATKEWAQVKTGPIAPAGESDATTHTHTHTHTHTRTHNLSL